MSSPALPSPPAPPASIEELQALVAMLQKQLKAAGVDPDTALLSLDDIKENLQAATRKLMAVPGSLAELLENATKKLKLPSGAKSIRTEKGDEVEDDADVALLRDDEVVFVLCGEEEFPLPGAAAA